MRPSLRLATLLFSIGLTAFALSVTPAQACSCSEPGPPCQGLSTHRAVFVGQVLAIEPVGLPGRPETSQRVTLRVDESFAGIETPTTTVLAERIGGGGCGYRFEVGGRYMVYGWERPDGQISVTICSRTRPVDDAGEDLLYFRSFREGPATAARIIGTAVLSENDYGLGSTPEAPFQGARIRVIQAGQSAEVTTDGNGAFDHAAALGPLDLRATLPPGYYAQAFPPSVEVRDLRACYRIRVAVHHDGHVRGRVIDAAGQAVAWLPVDLVRSDRDYPQFSGQTNARGEFDVARVAPGRYRLAVPGAPLLEPAAIRAPGPGEPVTVDRSATVDVGTVRVPADTVLALVRGRVVGADGHAIAGAEIFVSAGRADRPGTAFLVADSNGRFQFNAVSGQQYRVFAKAPGSSVAYQTRADLVPRAGTAPLQLTIR